MTDDPNATLVGRVRKVTRTRATEHFGSIPKPRLVNKVKRTVVGLVFVVVAIGIAKIVPEAPWWAKVGPAVLGALIMSGDLGKTSIQFAVGVIKDLLSAKKGDA